MIQRFLERLPNHRLEDVVCSGLMRDFSPGEKVRRKRIALIGLRGAGKSTLGSKLALEMRVPFIELDGEIEKDTGMPLRRNILALWTIRLSSDRETHTGEGAR